MPTDPGKAARDKLLQLEKRRQTLVVAQFGRIRDRLLVKIADLLERIEKERRTDGNAPPILLLQRARLGEILDAVTDEINRASKRLAAIASGSQATAVDIAREQAEEYPALQTELGFFDGEAVRELIGVGADGGVLDKWFSNIAKPVRRAMFDALEFGLAAGSSNAAIARDVREAIGGGTARAMTIVRTETNRAYREASRKFYDEVPAVRGWRWLAALDLRTCPICWALHGRVFPTKTKFGTHPNCRCVMVPVLEGEPGVPTGPELFDQLSDSQKKAILGPGRYELYTRGADLKDFVGQVRTPFGVGRVVKPIADVTFKPKTRTPVDPVPPKRGGATPVPGRPFPDSTVVDNKGRLVPKAPTVAELRERFVNEVRPIYGKFDATRDKLKKELEKINAKFDELQQAADARRPNVATSKEGSDKWFAERREIMAKRIAETAKVSAQLQDVAAAEKTQTAADRQRFYAPNPITLEAVEVSKFTKDEKAILKDALDEFARLVDASAWANPSKRFGVKKTRGRAYYFSGNIHVKVTESRKRVIIHETGHAFEKFNVEILKAANEFLRHRCGSEQPVALSKIYPRHGFGRDEIARPDKFTSAYVGKVYGPIGNQTSTEVISMGLEQLYAEPYKFATEDPEYFEFIISVLRGEKWQPSK